MSAANLDAAWLLGFDRAMRGRVPGPMRKDREGYRSAVKVAAQVLDLGAFNPLMVWDMQTVARLLREEAS
mgnify:CR=1 FL=1